MADKEFELRELHEEMQLGFKKEANFLNKLGERIAGMQEEAETLRQMSSDLESKFQQIEALLTETIEMFGDTNREGKTLPGTLLPDYAATQTGALEGMKDMDEEDREQLEKDMIQGYAKMARQVHENLERLRELIDSAEDEINQVGKELSGLDRAESIVEEIDEEMEKLDEKMGKKYEQGIDQYYDPEA